LCSPLGKEAYDGLPVADLSLRYIPFTCFGKTQSEVNQIINKTNMQSNGNMDRGDREVISIMFGVGVLFLIFLLMVFA
jgi:hypothetical protein